VPTLSEIFNFSGDFDGDSYYSILKGENSSNKFDFVYAQLNRMRSGPYCRIRSLSDINYTYVINVDKYFPNQCVDGWGFENCLFNSNYFIEKLFLQKIDKNRMNQRPREELITYRENNVPKLIDIDNSKIKKKMMEKLIEKMKKFNDPILKDKIFNKIY